MCSKVMILNSAFFIKFQLYKTTYGTHKNSFGNLSTAFTKTPNQEF
jgi:hypothetical protein